MGAAYFYHLTESPLEEALPMLVGRARDAGWRVLIRGRDGGLLERLDRVLWERPADGFLPHGRAGGAHDDRQPVLLAGEEKGAEGFACVMSVAGAGVDAGEVAAAERVCVLFDGHDEEALSHARGQWKALVQAGCAAQYWAQEGGRWVKKSQSGAA